MHIKLAGILPGQAIIEQNPPIPWSQRPAASSSIVVFHPRLRDGDVQHPGVVTGGWRQEGSAGHSNRQTVVRPLLRFLFQRQSGKNFAVNAGLGMLLVFSQIANLLLPDRLAIYFNI